MGEGFTPEFDREPIELERTPSGDINNCALANFCDEKDCQMCPGVCPDRARFDISKSKIGKWLAEKAQESLDEHVRPEIQVLAKRGNVTPDEVSKLYCNSWEWEHIIPAMNDEAFVARMEHAIKNCGFHRRPYASYNEAVEALFAPELLKRFKLVDQRAKLMEREVRTLGESLDSVREVLGQKETHYLVIPSDVAILVKALERYASQPLEKKDYTRAKVALAAVRNEAVFTTCEACGKNIVVAPTVRDEDNAPSVFCGACGGGCVSVDRDELLP